MGRILSIKNLQCGYEQTEGYVTDSGKQGIYYDYRHIDGKVFSCRGKSVSDCRIKRNKWLSK